MFAHIGRWFYDKPDLSPDKDGNVVLISKKSFGPLEVFSWGIDRNDKPYELYEWLENDFYEDESYRQNIAKEELICRVEHIIQKFGENGLTECIYIYEQILEKLKTGEISAK